jgi:predicted O-linked N-acetylglucosamine transferase (SPINDLY family)
MPTLAEALQIALEHHRAGRLEAAGEIYRRILEAEPQHADALHLLGVVAHQSGAQAVAEDYIRRAIVIAPAVAPYYNNLGEVYRAQGRLDEALACYQQALALTPDYPDVHNNLGEAWRGLRKLDQAVACYRRALELAPDFAAAWNNLGIALEEQGNTGEAVACYRRAIGLSPDFVAAHTNLGNVLGGQGQADDAAASYRRALACDPRAAATYNNLGSLLQRRGEFDEALACYQQALTLSPDYAGAHNNLGTLLRDQGRLADAIACFRRALSLNPDYVMAHSNYLCALRCDPAATPQDLAEAHVEFDRRFAVPMWTAWQPPPNRRTLDRPLRLGLVSPAFGLGPVGSFLIRAVEQLDRARTEVYCYSDRTTEDRLTARFQAASTQWRPTATLSDAELATQIRADQIDVLIDLAGHAVGNRLLVFARKPAPVQITWIDSVGSAGVSAIDYLLADGRLIPRELQRYYPERVLRMPGSYVCYEPAGATPDVGPLPALARGWVTFGSFNQPAKIHRQVIAAWSEILRRVPGSRLVLKYRGFAGPLALEQYRAWFEAEGIAPARVELEGHSPVDEYFGRYQQIDIALDPFPHNGGLTTCDALWMGVPVVTWPGETFASRQSLSHLTSIGLTETVARNVDQYVEIAAGLAGDLPRLAAIRAGLREQMQRSPLCDGRRFAEDLTAVLRGAWQRWADSAR